MKSIKFAAALSLVLGTLFSASYAQAAPKAQSCNGAPSQCQTFFGQ
ncbi:hypothetical protein [Chitinasiproducens palmae]|uniref:Uncharacterized protein n=1 Tax=Chitinasiproducens palmae TaxID=1770053 RepID=A0A1H2PNV1_9BURK|nr:hypothetical protein [Chitinasiproducens palmae]SDV48395.1 hypothetical protein SAMN05216551_10557 [Chitinasiproducens palmae]